MFEYFPGNHMWSVSVLRALASGAHLGEIDWVCKDLQEAAAQQPIGDGQAWYAGWSKLANQVEQFAGDSRQRGHIASARDAYLRSSIYYQWAAAFLDSDDARSAGMFEQHLSTFARGGMLTSPRVEVLDIPFGDAALSAYFVPAIGVKGKAPAVILSECLDGTKEELFYIARAMSQRGIACLAFDGPGQGATLRHRKLVKRHDTEVAVGAVCDYLATRDDIDGNRIGLTGGTMGAYDVARAVAFEKRIKACVAWSSIYDYYACWQRRMGYPAEAGVQTTGPGAARYIAGKQFLKNLGVADWDAAFRKLESFRLKGIASQITCDILLVHGAQDRRAPLAEAKMLFGEIGSQNKELWVYDEKKGGTAHMQLDRQEPALSRICDWFAERL